MVNKTDTQIPQLIINKLTKEQYEEALAQGLISETELYAVTDEDDYVTVNAFNNIIANYTTTENLANVALSGEYSDLLNTPTVDQVYNGSSTNAQSGVAISGLIANYSTTDSFSNVAFSGDFADLTNVPAAATVDQVYNGSSTNAQSGTAVAGLIANYMTSTEVSDAISNAISTVYKYKGSVATYADLPSSGQEVGDVYNVEEDGHNYAWTGTDWDRLAGTVDLSNYVTLNTVQTITNKTINLEDNTVIGLSTVATSGEYSDLLNKPTIDQIYNGSSTNAQSGTAIAGLISNYTTTADLADVALSGEYSDLLNTPELANVALSGDYADLLNTPTIDQTYNGSSANAQSGVAISGLIANYTDTANLADVALSGEYSDLLNKPTVDQTYNGSSANAQSGVAISGLIANYSTTDSFSNVAFSGDFADLTNVPAAATVDQVYNGSSTNAQSGVAISGLIANYSTTDSFSNVAFSGEYNDILNTPDLANVALSGEYSDLLNTPTIDQIYNGSSANAQSGTAVAGLIANYMTSTEVASAISNAIASVYRYKGSVATYADLPSSDLTVGDVYNVEEDGANYAWTGTSWDKLSENLSNYVTINGAATLTNKTIDLADNTIIGLSTVATSGEYSDLLNKPTIDQTYNSSSANAQSGVAVASAISDMQVVSNMVDIISNTSTNTTYPTTSAVYNSIANLSGVVFREWE
jgi:hypothetical protein